MRFLPCRQPLRTHASTGFTSCSRPFTGCATPSKSIRCRLAARDRRTGERRRGRHRAALRELVHRNRRRLGCAVHRRSDRLPPGVQMQARRVTTRRRRTSLNRVLDSAPRGGKHDPLPAPQGNAGTARTARQRRGRLACAGRRIFQAARLESEHQPPASRSRPHG